MRNIIQQERTILHCDMNNFYASVECMLDPRLRGRCVAVCGSQEERHGIVLAKNYPAKAFGVTTGEAVWQAKQKCPELVVVPPHFDRYVKYSRLVREMYYRYTDQVEPFGMDECWLDVTGSRCMGSGLEIAEALREGVKRELGLTISIGVSFNKVFAKLGSDMKKPDAITCIPKDSFREKVWPLPAGDMIGVGPATQRSLAVYGIRTIGQLANAPEDLMRIRFGKAGLALRRFANGEDQGRVARMGETAPVKSVGHGTTTLADLTEDEAVWQVMLSLTQEIGTRLREYGRKASGVAIDIRDNGLHMKQWQCGLAAPTHSALTLARAAHALFVRSYDWHAPIRSVTIRAIELVDENVPIQLDLFTDNRRAERRERLETAVESIRKRYGKDAVQNAVLCQVVPCKLREVEITMPTGMTACC